MATMNWIMLYEDDLIQARQSVIEAKQGYLTEIQVNDDHGHPHPQNRDCWGALYANALALRAELDNLLTTLALEFEDLSPEQGNPQ